MVMLNARPEEIDVDFTKTAVIVVDMQNAFVSPGGLFDLAGFDISGAPPVIENNKRLLKSAREAGVQVIYLQMSYDENLKDGGSPASPNYHKELAMVLMRKRPELKGTLLVEGSWDWQFHEELTPELGDQIIRKSRYSGFAGTHLDNYLRSMDIRHLCFTGVATNVCVESTARDAFFGEFWPILVEDAMNHSGPDFNRQATLWNFENVFGWVTGADELITAMGRGSN